MTEFKMVPPATLTESPTNPRRRGKDDLAELTQSIRSLGVLEPLLVRLAKGVMEIVSGSRRFRAAQEAGLTEVPVRILQLTDDEVLEVQIVENLQRRDVHPLDEADGFEALRKRFAVEAIADRVGKSAPYVYQRLQLLKLEKKARAAYEADKLTLGHAQLLARLQPKQQDDVLPFAQNATVRVLADDIQRRYFLDLTKAAFPKDACAVCPKRAGTTPALFQDIEKGDTCTDPVCFASKSAAFLKHRSAEMKDAPRVSVEHVWESQKLNALKKSGTLLEGDYRKAGSKKCPNTVEALIVNGQEAGGTMKVCPNKRCQVHAPKPERHEQAKYTPDPEVALKRKVKEEVRAAIVGKVKKLTTKDLCLVAVELWRGAREDVPAGVPVKAGVPVPATEEHASKLLVASLLVDDFEGRLADGLAKSLRVDVKAIEKKVRAEAAVKPGKAKKAAA